MHPDADGNCGSSQGSSTRTSPSGGRRLSSPSERPRPRGCRIIALVGPDGSGKTTVAHVISRRLSSLGHRPIEVWFRSANLLALPAYALLRLLGYSKPVRIEGEKMIRLDLSQHPSWYQLVMLAISLDYLAAYAVRIWIRSLITNRIVVCDRFVWDTLVDIWLLGGNNAFTHRMPQTNALAKLGNQANSFIVSAPADVLLRRRRTNALDPSFARRLELYATISDSYGLPMILNVSSPDETANEILRLSGFSV